MSTRSDPKMADSLRRALVRNDLLAAEAVFDVASILHVPGKSGLAGQYQGKEAILGLCARMAQLTCDTLHFTPSRVLSENDQAIVVSGRERATRRDMQLDADAVHVYSLRDCRVREMWIFHEDQDRVDDFWVA